MILYEYEGKSLLKSAGIIAPHGQVLTSPDDETSIQPPLVLKAQVLSGKRAEAGGIVMVDKQTDVKTALKKLFESVINKEKVEKVLVEQKVAIEKEYYLSLSYDTDTRGPVLTFSEAGGTGIEERKVQTYEVNPLGPTKNLPQDIDREVLEKLINLFFEQDMLLLEINPLVKTKDRWVALDAKIKLDDTAFGRHKNWQFLPRSVAGYIPTKHEIEAKKIDEGDYRGTAGSTYFDFDGDIAVLASGGGASITAMDALIALGGKPANFTEYSGNPPREKVEKLTKIVLDKPDLHGLWIVGALANFTDIYETLSGIAEALKKIEPKIKFPIVIRRAGPKDAEAFAMLKSLKDFDLHVYGEETSIPKSAEIITRLAKEYAQKKGQK